MTLRETLFAACFQAHLTTKKLPVIDRTLLGNPIHQSTWEGEFTKPEDGTFDMEGANAYVAKLTAASLVADKDALAKRLGDLAFDAHRVDGILFHVGSVPGGPVDSAREVARQLRTDLEVLAKQVRGD